MSKAHAMLTGRQQLGLRALVVALSLHVLGCSRTRGKDFPGGAALGDGGPVPCARCDDGVFCNGRERCDPVTRACLPGKAPTCDDRDECTIDRCDPIADRCERRAQPRDLDGDGFDACAGDCNDRDPGIHPGATETCDQVDQDCDGQTDEGLRSECGDCRPGCRLLYLPAQGDAWHPSADNSDAVMVEGDAGPLVLSSEMHRRFDAWIANFVDGQVTKLDTRDGRQLARYDSVLADGSNGAEPPGEACDKMLVG